MSLRLSHSASKALRTQCGRRDLVVRAPYLTRSIITCSLQEGQVLRPRSSNTPKTFGIRNKKQQPRCNSLSTSMSFSSNAILHQAKTVDYLLADVGEGITECEIVKWFVEPGSHVEEFDPLVEVQSDKASVEITSRYSGKVVEHCYQVGEVALVGKPLCRIEVVSQSAESHELNQDASPASEESIQIETQAFREPKTSNMERESTESPLSGRHKSLATPAVRRISKENGVDISEIRGTGKDGRVTKEDVQLHIDSQRISDVAVAQPSLSASQPDASNTRAALQELPLIGNRKAMFRAMSSAWNVPHFAYTDEIDVTEIDKIRSNLQSVVASRLQDSKYRLTLLPFLLKALSMALQHHALFRSTLDAERMVLQQSEEHRLSIAVASPRGLITPTLPGDIRDLSVLDIQRHISHLQERTNSERGLSLQEMGKGATVTLSNIGSVGGTSTFPIIPPTGQLLIGALGRAKILPRFDALDNIVKAKVMTASFTADHRVVEGVELARFVDDWKQLIENPTSWLVELR